MVVWVLRGDGWLWERENLEAIQVYSLITLRQCRSYSKSLKYCVHAGSAGCAARGEKRSAYSIQFKAKHSADGSGLWQKCRVRLISPRLSVRIGAKLEVYACASKRLDMRRKSEESVIGLVGGRFLAFSALGWVSG